MTTLEPTPTGDTNPPMVAFIAPVPRTPQDDEPTRDARAAVPDDVLDDLDETEDEQTGLPPLLRRPEAVADPVLLGDLRRVRKALGDNPKVALDADAVGVVVAGAVDPTQMHAYALVEKRGARKDVNLLTTMPVAEGSLYALPPHLRYLDLNVLPDVHGARFGNQVRTALDPAGPGTSLPDYETLQVPVTVGEQTRFVTGLSLRVRNRAALAEAVAESMRQTHAAPGDNDYTDSVLQQGVQVPLSLILLRVQYDDGTHEDFLMTADGNSRLVSMWLARTGGDIDEAAAACVRAVLGVTDNTGARRKVDPAKARKNVKAMATRLRRGLGEEVLTEETRRLGHTLAFPAVVVVGARAADGSPLTDLVAAMDELLANLHVRVTPWAAAAQYAKGMERVYRRAFEAGIIDHRVHAVLSGAVSVQQMHESLGLPPHRLWASAKHQEVMLSRRQSEAMKRLVREEFGLGRADRERLGARLGVPALSPYRSLDTGLERPLNAFGNGGTICDPVWRTSWRLTPGDEPLAVLDEVLEKALAGDRSARAELAVLGGTAAILSGLLTRDRGSKEGTVRADLKTPYRAVPPTVLAALTATAGGLRMLHSIARAHVAADPAVLPKAFHTVTGEVDGVLVQDGAPVIDGAGAHQTLAWEWDLFEAADPRLAEETIAENLAEAQAGRASGSSEAGLSEDAVQRKRLDDGVKAATKAVMALARLTTTHGRDVFGNPEVVSLLRRRIRNLDEVLVAFGPVRTTLPDLGDEDEDDDA